MLTQISKHSLQVLQIQQEHAFIICHSEEDVHHAGLGIIQAKHTAQEQRSHFLHGSTDRMSLLAIHIPKHGWECLVLEAGHAAGRQPLCQPITVLAGANHTAQIALHVAQEHRNTHVRKAFCQHLQGHSFPRARGSGNQAVTVGHLRQQTNRFFSRASPDFPLIKHPCIIPFSRISMVLLYYVRPIPSRKILCKGVRAHLTAHPER